MIDALGKLFRRLIEWLEALLEVFEPVPSPPRPPGAPRDLEVIAMSKSILISWTRAATRADGSPLAPEQINYTSVQLALKDDPAWYREIGQVASLDASHADVKQEFQQNQLDPGAYFVRVQHVDIEGNKGAFAFGAITLTGTVPAPAAPAAVKVVEVPAPAPAT